MITKNGLIMTVLGAVVFSIVFYLLFHFFFYFFIVKSNIYISNGVGAFMGAFSAFIFLIFEKTFSKYRERRVKHLNALVRSEYLLNENLQFIADNIFLLDGFVKIIKKGGFHSGAFNEILWDKTILLDLANLEMINRLGDYAISVRKINRDTSMLEGLYSEIKTALVEGHINKATYDYNIPLVLDRIEIIKNYYQMLDVEIERRQSEVRVLLKNKSPVDWFFDKITTDHLPSDFEKKVDDEEKVLIAERDEIRKKAEKAKPT